MKVTVFILTLALALIASSNASNYYISASGAIGNGNGSSAANSADASTSAKYRALIDSQQVAGTVIVYAAGTYLASSDIPMYNNVTHQGAGIDKTIIQVASGSGMEYGVIKPHSSSAQVTGWKMLDITCDCNAKNTSWWASGSGSSQMLSFSLADHCTIQRVKFINMGAKGQESFPIFFVNGNTANGNLNNNLVDSCVFTQPIVSGNTSGITCIELADAEPSVTVDNTNVVSNCQFLNMMYPTYSDMNYAHASWCPVFINNVCSGMDVAWYAEPGSSSTGNNVFFTGQTVQITGNKVTGGFVMHMAFLTAGGNFAGNLNVQNNTVNMGQSAYNFYGGTIPEAVVFQGGPSENAAIGSVTVQNNTFTAATPVGAQPVAVNFNPQSPSLYHAASLSILNNHLIGFPGSTPNAGGAQWSINTGQLGAYTNSGNVLASSTATGPYKGTPTSLPGNVYASNYDLGGQGSGYNDTIGSNPGTYRVDGVDLKASSDPGTGYVLGWRTVGEWTNYTVNVAQTGLYNVSARIESAVGTGQFHVSIDGKTVIAALNVPLTGPWDTASSWKTISLGSLNLTSGKHIIQVYVDAAWFDLNFLSFTSSSPTPTPTPIPTPPPTPTPTPVIYTYSGWLSQLNSEISSDVSPTTLTTWLMAHPPTQD